MGTFYQHMPQETESRWRPVIIAVVMIVVVTGVIWLVALKVKHGAPTQPVAVPYAENLGVQELKLSTAENFVGGSVTYVEGKIVNAGYKIVTAAQVEVVFRNSLGEVVQTENQPLRVQEKVLGEPDFVGLNVAPLGPNTSRQFRLTFEHISADWNQGYPEVRFVKITTKD
jgi:hypothetical protein